MSDSSALPSSGGGSCVVDVVHIDNVNVLLMLFISIT